MAAVLLPSFKIGQIYGSGAKMYMYEVGTTTDLTVYQEFALSNAHTQPIVANSNGVFPDIYLDATANDIKIVVTDADDVELFTLARYPIEDITTLSADLDTAEASLVTLAGRVTTNETDIDTLQTESTDYESRISTNETDIAALQGASAPTGAVAAAFFVGQTNPTFAQSTGFSGVSKNSTGQFDLTFSVARANANYIVIATAGPQSASSPLECLATNKSTAGFRVETWYLTGGSTRDYQDRDVNVVVFDLDA